MNSEETGHNLYKGKEIAYINNPEDNLKIIYVMMLLKIAKTKYNLKDIDVDFVIKLIEKSSIGEEIENHKLSKNIINAFSFILMQIIKDSPEKLGTIDNYNENEIISGLWLDDLKNNKNPIVIYKGNEPLYWNTSMEKITGYTFTEIKERYNNGEDIMVLLYGWSETELNKVKGALGKGKSYENAVFTIKAKNGELHQVAWFTRFKEYNGELYSIRTGSEETSKIIEYLDQSNIAVRDMFNDIMTDKDSVTKGHINRVRIICNMIGKNAGYSDYLLEQLSNMSFLHDLGKRFIDNKVLKKTGDYTQEDKDIMNSHPGMGIEKVLDSGYEVYAEGMVHHSNFYSPEGDFNLKFDDIVNIIKKWDGKEDKETKINIYLLFNKLLGKNIPEAGRIISIADTIDAIVSRRSYSERAGKPIGEIIEFVTKELLRSTGLIEKDGKILLNKDIWIKTKKQDDIDLPYSIEFLGNHYIPRKDSKIQFDPLILIKNYENGDLLEEIKTVISENDKEVVKDKVEEFFENIKLLKEKKEAHIKSITGGMGKCPKEFEFTDIDEIELQRLTGIYDSLLQINKEYSSKGSDSSLYKNQQYI